MERRKERESKFINLFDSKRLQRKSNKFGLFDHNEAFMNCAILVPLEVVLVIMDKASWFGAFGAQNIIFI